MNKKVLSNLVDHYARAINRIDDYIEHKHPSQINKVEIYDILDNLALRIQKTMHADNSDKYTIDVEVTSKASQVVHDAINERPLATVVFRYRNKDTVATIEELMSCERMSISNIDFMMKKFYLKS